MNTPLPPLHASALPGPNLLILALYSARGNGLDEKLSRFRRSHPVPPCCRMQPERRAVIDIGTNSVKLLVGDVAGGSVTPVLEKSDQTRLGHGFYETHVLQPDAVARTAVAVASFVGEAEALGARGLQTIATSAVRDARNPRDLTEAIRAGSGQSLRIISGEEEADYAYKGVITDPRYAHGDLFLLDMGGGSTEFVFGRGRRKIFQDSIALGALRLLDLLRISDPPTPEDLTGCRKHVSDLLKNKVSPSLKRELSLLPRGSVQLVGTGGTAGILARVDAGLTTYDRDIMESVVIPLERLRRHMEHLWSLPLAMRREVPGLPRSRADVILPGIVSYLEIMEEFGFADLRVSTRGLRFALLLEDSQAD